jgi:hypothetical protein
VKRVLKTIPLLKGIDDKLDKLLNTVLSSSKGLDGRILKRFGMPVPQRDTRDTNPVNDIENRTNAKNITSPGTSPVAVIIPPTAVPPVERSEKSVNKKRKINRKKAPQSRAGRDINKDKLPGASPGASASVSPNLVPILVPNLVPGTNNQRQNDGNAPAVLNGKDTLKRRKEDQERVRNKGFLKTVSASFFSIGGKIVNQVKDISGADSGEGKDAAGLAAGGPLWGAIQEVTEFASTIKGNDTLTGRIATNLFKKFVSKKAQGDEDKISEPKKDKNGRLRDAKGHFIKSSEKQAHSSKPVESFHDEGNSLKSDSIRSEKNKVSTRSAVAVERIQAENGTGENEDPRPRKNKSDRRDKKGHFIKFPKEGTTNRGPKSLENTISPPESEGVGNSADKVSAISAKRQKKESIPLRDDGLTTPIRSTPSTGQRQVEDQKPGKIVKGLATNTEKTPFSHKKRFKVDTCSLTEMITSKKLSSPIAKKLQEGHGSNIETERQGGNEVQPGKVIESFHDKKNQPESDFLQSKKDKSTIAKYPVTNTTGILKETKAIKAGNKEDERRHVTANVINNKSNKSVQKGSSKTYSRTGRESTSERNKSTVTDRRNKKTDSKAKDINRTIKTPGDKQTNSIKQHTELFEKEIEGTEEITKAIKAGNKEDDRRHGQLLKAIAKSFAAGEGVLTKGGSALAGLGATATGGLGLSGLLSAGAGTALTGGLGAGAMASSVGLVGAAGAAGYGAGTLINKGIGKLTGGGDGWAGNWLFDKIHGGDDKKRKKAEAKKYSTKFKDRMTPEAFKMVGGEKSFDVGKLSSLVKSGEIIRSTDGMFRTETESPDSPEALSSNKDVRPASPKDAVSVKEKAPVLNAKIVPQPLREDKKQTVQSTESSGRNSLAPVGKINKTPMQKVKPISPQKTAPVPQNGSNGQRNMVMEQRPVITVKNQGKEDNRSKSKLPSNIQTEFDDTVLILMAHDRL